MHLGIYTASTGHFMGGKLFFSIMPVEGNRTCIAVAPPAMFNSSTPQFDKAKSITDAGNTGKTTFDVLPERVFWATAEVSQTREIEFDNVHVMTLTDMDINSINLLFDELLHSINENEGNKNLGVPENVSRHIESCCRLHGCSTGYLRCPVAENEVAQKYPCEACLSMTDTLIDIMEAQKLHDEGDHDIDHDDRMTDLSEQLALLIDLDKSIITDFSEK